MYSPFIVFTFYCMPPPSSLCMHQHFVQIIANLVINNHTLFPNGNDNDNHGDFTAPLAPSKGDRTTDGSTPTDPNNNHHNNNPTAGATDDTSSKPTTPTGSHSQGPTSSDSVAAAAAATRRLAVTALVLALGAFALALYSAYILTCRKGQVMSLQSGGVNVNDSIHGSGVDGAGGSSKGGTYQHSRVGGGNGGVKNEDLGFVVTRGTAPGRGGYSSVQMT